MGVDKPERWYTRAHTRKKGKFKQNWHCDVIQGMRDFMSYKRAFG
jgi:hypothetical protein